ncbi:MAG: hypothetical protein ABWZ99_16755 [Ilumatobacteraceae bacterium]
MGTIDRNALPWRGLAAAGLAAVLVLSACGSDATEEANEDALATQFVASVHAAGVAPRLTPDAAASLYGTDAPAVCGAFDGELSTSARNVLFGNLRQGRRKTITDDAVTYGRLVVETYCPDQLADFDLAVSVLDPFETSGS